VGPLTGAVTGNVTGDLTGNVTGDLTGNADTATALETARDIAVSGDVTGSASFDGTGNISISTTIAANTVGITEIDVSDGTAGQALVTDGSGTLSFDDAGISTGKAIAMAIVFG